MFIVDMHQLYVDMFYRKICLTPSNIIRRPFPFPYADSKSLFENPRAKNIIFPHICSLPIVQHVCAQVAQLQPAYIRICAQN